MPLSDHKLHTLFQLMDHQMEGTRHNKRAAYYLKRCHAELSHNARFFLVEPAHRRARLLSRRLKHHSPIDVN